MQGLIQFINDELDYHETCAKLLRDLKASIAEYVFSILYSFNYFKSIILILFISYRIPYNPRNGTPLRDSSHLGAQGLVIEPSIIRRTDILPPNKMINAQKSSIAESWDGSVSGRSIRLRNDSYSSQKSVAVSNSPLNSANNFGDVIISSASKYVDEPLSSSQASNTLAKKVIVLFDFDAEGPGEITSNFNNYIQAL